MVTRVAADGAWGASTRLFYELTPEIMLDAVERFGFRCTGRWLALNSMENRVVDFEVDDSWPAHDPRRSRIGKFHRPGRWSREQILQEHQFLEELAEEEVPVVAPLRTVEGETLVDCGAGIYLALFPKVGGRMPDELSPQQVEQLGRLLARLHLVGARRPADHRLTLTPEVYGEANLDLLLNLEVVSEEDEEALIELVEAICQWAAPRLADQPVQRIHGDCHLGNVLWGPHGPFLVDFDDMVNGPPVQDLWLVVPGRDPADQELRRRLVGSYRELCEFEESWWCVHEALRALRYVHFAAWMAHRWEDPAFPRAFPHFGTRTYWRELIRDLQECYQLLPGAP